MSYRIYCIEDDTSLRDGLLNTLKQYGYEAAAATDFSRAVPDCLAYEPHLILLDVNLPFQDGFQLCRALRRHSKAPILFLTARAGDLEQVLGLESGGDDWVTKPFQLEVLLAKVRALLRRTYGEYAHGGPANLLTVGQLTLNLSAATVALGGVEQPLTRTEVRLLHLLMQQPDQTISRERCLEAIWDDEQFVDDNTLTVNVTRLRQKLDLLGVRGAIQTRRGLGYQLLTQRWDGAR